MRFQINGRNIVVTPALKEYIEEKIGKIAKHHGGILDIEVTLGVTKNPSVHDNHFTEVTCSLNGTKIHVHEEAESMYASIDLLADKLDRQVRKQKERTLKSKIGSQSIRMGSPEEIAEEETESELGELDINLEIKE